MGKEKESESVGRKLGCALMVFGVIVGSQLIVIKPLLGSIFVLMVVVGIVLWVVGK
jgi:hypothetical protein